MITFILQYRMQW